MVLRKQNEILRQNDDLMAYCFTILAAITAGFFSSRSETANVVLEKKTLNAVCVGCLLGMNFMLSQRISKWVAVKTLAKPGQRFNMRVSIERIVNFRTFGEIQVFVSKSEAAVSSRAETTQSQVTVTRREPWPSYSPLTSVPMELSSPVLPSRCSMD